MEMPNINNLTNDRDLLIAIWTQQGILLSQNSDLLGKVERSNAEQNLMRVELTKTDGRLTALIDDLLEHKQYTSNKFKEQSEKTKLWDGVNGLGIILSGLAAYFMGR